MTPSGKLPAAAPEIKGADDPLVCEMIWLAARAGAYRVKSRELPNSPGLVRMMKRCSFEASDLAHVVAARARA